MVTCQVLTCLFFLTTTQAVFFGQRFTGEHGVELQITGAVTTAEEAWKQHSCDAACGERCLEVSTGAVLQACIGFCGCSQLVQTYQQPEIREVFNSQPENCPATCEALCNGKSSHCVSECNASFCVSLPAEGGLSFLVGLGLEVVGLAAILLFLGVCYSRLQNKKRRRMRLNQEAEGTYRML